MSSLLTMLQRRYHISERSLHEQISMKPKDILIRSVQAGNWSTLLIILICYPILFYFRGLDFQLLFGMMVLYASFWAVVFLMVLLIQLLWLINYFISQRFVENMLDFEIFERIFGQGQSQDDEDYLDDEREVFDSKGNLRAKG